MKYTAVKALIPGSLLVLVVLTTGCADQSGNLQAINQTLGETQRTVDTINTVTQTTQAPTVNKEALKAAGKEMILQNPTGREAAQTVDSSRNLLNSIKQLGQPSAE
ncbi:MAG: hypothetical protein CVV13_10535 [Gammaproteobacteria bacterium HGW-Gammaproteobacteria-3]|nr:MAG: hypothetical protein CVV13_10535 [Gammaproteobacteria bacterium HGW-Gammaproteobacteria-3]